MAVTANGRRSANVRDSSHRRNMRDLAIMTDNDKCYKNISGIFNVEIGVDAEEKGVGVMKHRW
jgi:hypothetical protein